MEILPHTCQGILMFSTNKQNECGTKCDNIEARNAGKRDKRGWTKWIKYY